MPSIKGFFIRNRFSIILSFIFLVLAGVSMSYHEMWLDEWQEWLIAKDSASICDVLAVMKYSGGHPGLWTLLLFSIARFTSSAAAMQTFHLLIATGVIFVFARFSPFSKLQKILFSFGYFPFYQYAVISRNYSLCILFFFLACALFPHRDRRFILVGVLLFLMSWTHFFGILLAIALTLGFLTEFTLSKQFPSKWTAVSGFSLIASGILTAAIQLIPPADAYFKPMTLGSHSLSYLFKSLASAFFFTPSLLYSKWYLLGTFCVVLIMLILVFMILLRKPAALFIYTSLNIAFLTFFYSQYGGYTWHYGFIYISLIGSLWLFHFASTATIFNKSVNSLSLRLGKALPMVLTILLCIQLLKGAEATFKDYLRPYSQSKNVADYIRKNQLDDKLLIGDLNVATCSVGGYLGRKIYYPHDHKMGSFMMNKSDHKTYLTPEEVLLEAKRQGNDFLLILSYPLSASLETKYHLKEIANFEGAITKREIYYLYIPQT